MTKPAAKTGADAAAGAVGMKSAGDMQRSTESGSAGARTVGTELAMEGKTEPETKPRRKRRARIVAPLPEGLARLLAKAAAEFAAGQAPNPESEAGAPGEEGGEGG
jgi:hypothetical protein